MRIVISLPHELCPFSAERVLCASLEPSGFWLVAFPGLLRPLPIPLELDFGACSASLVWLALSSLQVPSSTSRSGGGLRSGLPASTQ